MRDSDLAAMPDDMTQATWVNESLNKEAIRIIDLGSAAEAVRFFMEGVEACDKEQIRRALDVIEATGAQPRVLQRLKKLTPTDDVRKSFRSFWDEFGWTIRMKVADDSALCDALRNLLEPYKGPPMTLYRGEIAAQYDKGIYGISWTTDVKAAGMFARGLNCLEPAGGVLLESLVPAEAIISPPSEHSKHLQEYEFPVDVRGLNEVRVLKRFPWTEWLIE